MTQDRIFVGEVARLIGICPKALTNLFYRHQLDTDRCPVVGGRRLVPQDDVQVICEVLRGRRNDPNQCVEEGASSGQRWCRVCPAPSGDEEGKSDEQY